MARYAKEYYLMHKDIRVCLMEISDDGVLGNVRRNEAARDHFPLGGQMKNSYVKRALREKKRKFESFSIGKGFVEE